MPKNKPSDSGTSSRRPAGRQGKVDPEERIKVWVRSGGRCAFCNEYLLESELTRRPVLLGEVAHNAAASDDGPRGDAAISVKDRNSAENLILLCGHHHPDADKRVQLDLLTVVQLRAFKAEHERRIRQATESVGGKRTALLRMQGHVRGAIVDVGLEAATEAVLRSSNRFPELPLSFDRHGVEIDLRHVAGEAEGSPTYYRGATARIDEVVNQILRPAAEKSVATHLSVFAFARLPLLVYLGARVDDALTVDVFQRHRATEDWVWPEPRDDDPTFTFRLEAPLDGTDVSLATEALLIINASGTIHRSEAPKSTVGMPALFVEFQDGIAHPDSVRSRSTLGSFEAVLRSMLGQLEQDHKTIRTLHVLAAAPVSVGVTLGRSVGWGIHPSLVIYDRLADSSYHPALEVTAP
jgi:SMODS-associated and fused to various effectors sensor domain